VSFNYEGQSADNDVTQPEPDRRVKPEVVTRADCYSIDLLSCSELDVHWQPCSRVVT